MSDLEDVLNDVLVHADIEVTDNNMQHLFSNIPYGVVNEAEEWGWRDTEIFAQVYRIAEDLFYGND